jgi:hypothetical protein
MPYSYNNLVSAYDRVGTKVWKWKQVVALPHIADARRHKPWYASVQQYDKMTIEDDLEKQQDQRRKKRN